MYVTSSISPMRAVLGLVLDLGLRLAQCVTLYDIYACLIIQGDVVHCI